MILLVLVFTSGDFAMAADASPEPSAAETFRETFSWRTLKGDFTSPFTTPAKYALATGTALTAVAMIFKKEIDEPINDAMKRDRPLGDDGTGDKFGQLVPNVLYFGSMLATYSITGEARPLRRANLMFRSTLHSGIVTIALKNTLRAGRPYNNDVKTSFPSGHSSSSFAFASAVAMEHEWYWGLGAYAVATYVGASRINDHQHHFRDVLAGATIGISYGMGVFYRMKEEETSGLASNVSWALLPTDDLAGATLIYKKAF